MSLPEKKKEKTTNPRDGASLSARARQAIPFDFMRVF
jgi:hypothetical protein